MGCGAYKFVKYATDQYIEFAAFDKFFLGKPKIAKAFLRIVNPDTAIAQLENGELDLLMGENPGQYSQHRDPQGQESGQPGGHVRLQPRAPRG